MGVRVEIGEGEPIEDALKRLRKLIYDEGGSPLVHPRWHKKRHDRYQKPSVYRRRRRWVAVERRIRGWDVGPEDELSIAFELRPRAFWAWA